jgi:hypothetical protein
MTPRTQLGIPFTIFIARHNKFNEIKKLFAATTFPVLQLIYKINSHCCAATDTAEANRLCYVKCVNCKHITCLCKLQRK